MLAVGSSVTGYYESCRWITLGTFPEFPLGFQDITDHQVIVADNELYLAGGEYDHMTRDDICYLDFFYHFNRLDNKWIQLSPMITKRSCFAMVHLNDHIYAIGGKGPVQWPFDVLLRVERYSLLTGEWEKVANLPVTLEYLSAIAYKDKILVYGVLRDNESQECLFAYDPETDTWTQLLPDLVEDPHYAFIPPFLVVEDHDCYRVKYVNNVAQVNRLTLQLDNTAPLTGQLCSSHNPTDQTEVPIDPAAGPFCINKRLFVNLRGYIHRLNCTLENMYSGDSDNAGWEEFSLDSSAAFVNFTFDKNIYSVL